MRLAQYSYQIIHPNVLYVKDLKNNNLPTLTNTIEEVLAEICRKEKLDLSRLVVIQKDSEDIYSKVSFDENSFMRVQWEFLSKVSLEEALNKLS